MSYINRNKDELESFFEKAMQALMIEFSTDHGVVCKNFLNLSFSFDLDECRPTFSYKLKIMNMINDFVKCLLEKKEFSFVIDLGAHCDEYVIRQLLYMFTYVYSDQRDSYPIPSVSEFAGFVYAMIWANDEKFFDMNDDLFWFLDHVRGIYNYSFLTTDIYANFYKDTYHLWVNDDIKKKHKIMFNTLFYDTDLKDKIIWLAGNELDDDAKQSSYYDIVYLAQARYMADRDRKYGFYKLSYEDQRKEEQERSKEFFKERVFD